ncbi:MAG: 50S ribosomal protein L15 [Thermoleophilia bacterium]|jgi:large subunit ribosomal protein L15|nr:50S ribosomal protein L15 [Actinomycetota bacterium]MCL6092849.1 50S ribosomal protein L15 [Actinomycetota bacterium]MDA8166419.1 50S ribosomal protein L15 [Actinomycetota bacterium]
MSTEDTKENEAGYVGLHNLKPSPGSRHARKRVGRGHGSGHGKTSGRGHKGFNSRSGGGVRAGYEGGQMPLYMRVGKLRGPNKKMSMPFGPFRTSTQGVNVGRLGGFAAGATVTAEALVDAGIIKNTKTPLKILGHGEIKVALTVQANGFSKSAREKIEAAGGKAEVV